MKVATATATSHELSVLALRVESSRGLTSYEMGGARDRSMIGRSRSCMIGARVGLLRFGLVFRGLRMAAIAEPLSTRLPGNVILREHKHTSSQSQSTTKLLAFWSSLCESWCLQTRHPMSRFHACSISKAALAFPLAVQAFHHLGG